MAHTTFVDYSAATPVVAAWLNDVDKLAYGVGSTAGQVPISQGNGATLAFGSVSGASTTFQQVGTGSVVRTMLAKAQENFSVLDFGAVGDGVADDTTAIQAAITAAGARANGGAVIFPSGKYKVTATLNIASAHVTLLGASRDSVLISRTTAFGPIFNFTTASSSILDTVGIHSMVLSDGGTNNQSGTHINVDNVTRFSASDLIMFGGTNGIIFKAASNVQVTNVYMSMQNASGTSAGHYGIQVTNTAIGGAPSAFGSNMYFTNVAIYGGDQVAATYSNLDDCIRVEAVDGLWITGCYAGGSAVANLHLAHTNASYTCGDIFTVNNMLDICRGNGILIDGTQICAQIVLDNTVSCTQTGVAAKDGILVTGPVDRLVIRGNVSGWKGNGLNLGGANPQFTHVAITGMYVTNNTGFGLALNADTALNNVIITGNDFTGNTGGSVNDLSAATTTKYLEGNVGYSTPWIAYTPAIGSAGGSITAVATGKYKQIANVVQVEMKITSVTADTGTGYVTWTLPANPGNAADVFAFAANNTNTNVACTARTQSASQTAVLLKYDGTYPSAVGQTFVVSGTYQV